MSNKRHTSVTRSKVRNSRAKPLKNKKIIVASALGVAVGTLALGIGLGVGLDASSSSVDQGLSLEQRIVNLNKQTETLKQEIEKGFQSNSKLGIGEAILSLSGSISDLGDPTDERANSAKAEAEVQISIARETIKVINMNVDIKELEEELSKDTPNSEAVSKLRASLEMQKNDLSKSTNARARSVITNLEKVNSDNARKFKIVDVNVKTKELEVAVDKVDLQTKRDALQSLVNDYETSTDANEIKARDDANKEIVKADIKISVLDLQAEIAKPDATKASLEQAKDALRTLITAQAANTDSSVRALIDTTTPEVEKADNKILSLDIKKEIETIKSATTAADIIAANNRLSALVNTNGANTDPNVVAELAKARVEIAKVNNRIKVLDINSKITLLQTLIAGSDSAAIENAKAALKAELPASVSTDAGIQAAVASANAEITKADNKVIVLNVNAKITALDTAIAAGQKTVIQTALDELKIVKATGNNNSDSSVTTSVNSANSKIEEAENKIIELNLIEQTNKVNTAITAEVSANITREKNSLDNLIEASKDNRNTGVIAARTAASTAISSAQTTLDYLTTKADIVSKTTILNRLLTGDDDAAILTAKNNLNSAIPTNPDSRLASTITNARTALSNAEQSGEKRQATAVDSEVATLTSATTKADIIKARTDLQSLINGIATDANTPEVLTTAITNARTAIAGVDNRIKVIDINAKTTALQEAITGNVQATIQSAKTALQNELPSPASTNTDVIEAVRLANLQIAEADVSLWILDTNVKVATLNTKIAGSNVAEITTARNAVTAKINSAPTSKTTAITTAETTANTAIENANNRITTLNLITGITNAVNELNSATTKSDITTKKASLQGLLPTIDANTDAGVSAAATSANAAVANADNKVIAIDINAAKETLTTAIASNDIDSLTKLQTALTSLTNARFALNSLVTQHNTNSSQIVRDAITSANTEITNADNRALVLRLKIQNLNLGNIVTEDDSSKWVAEIKKARGLITSIGTNGDAGVTSEITSLRTQITTVENTVITEKLRDATVALETANSGDSIAEIRKQKKVLEDMITMYSSNEDNRVRSFAEVRGPAAIKEAENKLLVVDIQEKSSALTRVLRSDTTSLMFLDKNAISNAKTELETLIPTPASINPIVVAAVATANPLIQKATTVLSLINTMEDITAKTAVLTTATNEKDENRITSARATLVAAIPTEEGRDGRLTSVIETANAAIRSADDYLESRAFIANIVSKTATLTQALGGTSIDDIMTAKDALIEVIPSPNPYNNLDAVIATANTEIAKVNGIVAIKKSITDATTALQTVSAGTDEDKTEEARVALANLVNAYDSNSLYATEVNAAKVPLDAITIRIYTPKVSAQAISLRAAIVQVDVAKINLQKSLTRELLAIPYLDKVDSLSNQIRNLRSDLSSTFGRFGQSPIGEIKKQRSGFVDKLLEALKNTVSVGTEIKFNEVTTARNEISEKTTVAANHIFVYLYNEAYGALQGYIGNNANGTMDLRTNTLATATKLLTEALKTETKENISKVSNTLQTIVNLIKAGAFTDPETTDLVSAAEAELAKVPAAINDATRLKNDLASTTTPVKNIIDGVTLSTTKTDIEAKLNIATTALKAIVDAIPPAGDAIYNTEATEARLQLTKATALLASLQTRDSIVEKTKALETSLSGTDIDAINAAKTALEEVIPATNTDNYLTESIARAQEVIATVPNTIKSIELRTNLNEQVKKYDEVFLDPNSKKEDVLTMLDNANKVILQLLPGDNNINLDQVSSDSIPQGMYLNNKYAIEAPMLASRYFIDLITPIAKKLTDALKNTDVDAIILARDELFSRSAGNQDGNPAYKTIVDGHNALIAKADIAIKVLGVIEAQTSALNSAIDRLNTGEIESTSSKLRATISREGIDEIEGLSELLTLSRTVLARTTPELFTLARKNGEIIKKINALELKIAMGEVFTTEKISLEVEIEGVTNNALSIIIERANAIITLSEETNSAERIDELLSDVTTRLDALLGSGTTEEITNSRSSLQAAVTYVEGDTILNAITTLQTKVATAKTSITNATTTLTTIPIQQDIITKTESLRVAIEQAHVTTDRKIIDDAKKELDAAIALAGTTPHARLTMAIEVANRELEKVEDALFVVKYTNMWEQIMRDFWPIDQESEEERNSLNINKYIANWKKSNGNFGPQYGGDNENPANSLRKQKLYTIYGLSQVTLDYGDSTRLPDNLLKTEDIKALLFPIYDIVKIVIRPLALASSEVVRINEINEALSLYFRKALSTLRLLLNHANTLGLEQKTRELRGALTGNDIEVINLKKKELEYYLPPDKLLEGSSNERLFKAIAAARIELAKVDEKIAAIRELADNQIIGPGGQVLTAIINANNEESFVLVPTVLKFEANEVTLKGNKIEKEHSGSTDYTNGKEGFFKIDFLNIGYVKIDAFRIYGGYTSSSPNQRPTLQTGVTGKGVVFGRYANGQISFAVENILKHRFPTEFGTRTTNEINIPIKVVRTAIDGPAYVYINNNAYKTSATDQTLFFGLDADGNPPTGENIIRIELTKSGNDYIFPNDVFALLNLSSPGRGPIRIPASTTTAAVEDYEVNIKLSSAGSTTAKSLAFFVRTGGYGNYDHPYYGTTRVEYGAGGGFFTHPVTRDFDRLDGVNTDLAIDGGEYKRAQLTMPYFYSKSFSANLMMKLFYEYNQYKGQEAYNFLENVIYSKENQISVLCIDVNYSDDEKKLRFDRIAEKTYATIEKAYEEHKLIGYDFTLRNVYGEIKTYNCYAPNGYYA